jgi:cation transport ATPase
MKSNDPLTEELDLAIPNMRFPEDERQVEHLLRNIIGITAVRIVQSGALVSYQPQTLSHDKICAQLRNAGYRATTFQDSRTGEIRQASV